MTNAPLDPGFLPPVLWNRRYLASVRKAGDGVSLVLGLERENGLVLRNETIIRRGGDARTVLETEFPELASGSNLGCRMKRAGVSVRPWQPPAWPS